MDTLDDSENNAKISDSAYSNSCSNSQSRRSHSSKSTHSGSHSSGSSGYGGNPSTSGCGSTITSKPPEKRLTKKDNKKKKSKVKSSKSKSKSANAQPQPKCVPPEPVKEFKVPKREIIDVAMRSSPSGSNAVKGVESREISSKDRTNQEQIGTENNQFSKTMNVVPCRSSNANISENFSCVISMHDGVVMYTTSSITPVLGYPREMLTGRSFLDFVHERDRNVFASQITSGLAVPKKSNGMPIKAITQVNTTSSVVCRLRRYRGLTSSFSVKDKSTAFIPFQLKLSFKKITSLSEHGIYLVVRATPFYPAYQTSYELIPQAVPFIIRHSANGNMEFVDPESVPYLGYLPHDLIDKNALQLYHPHDLDYLQHVYETTVREGSVPRGSPYRMMAQNGDYIKLETEWSSFINPWSKKLEFVIGKHHVIEGPRNPDVYQPPNHSTMFKLNEDDKAKTQCMRENIVRIMNEVLTKPAEIAKQQMAKRCQDIAALMESLIEESPKHDEDLRMDLHDVDNSYYERDTVMLGGISPHHDFNDGKSSTDTPLSYNQLNYNDNLQRYFDSHQSFVFEEMNIKSGDNIYGITDRIDDSGDRAPSLQRNIRSGGEGSSRQSKSIPFTGPLSISHNYVPVRLTESLLRKHNAEMEKELFRLHRETRVCSRSEREKAIIENRQKKKEHLARCNAAFQPTSAGLNPAQTQQLNEQIYNVPHGLKRTTKSSDTEAGAHKHPCTSPRQQRRWATTTTTTTSSSTTHTSTVVTTATVATPWSSTSEDNNVNAFLVGLNVPQPMPLLNTVSTVPAVVPMYYTSAANRTMSGTPRLPSQPRFPYQAPPMPCMMYGQTMYGQPFMYGPINPHPAYDTRQSYISQSQAFASSINPLLLTNRNYDELKPKQNIGTGGRVWRQKRKSELQARFMKQRGGGSSSSAENSNGAARESRAKVERGSRVFSETTVSVKSTEAIADASRRSKSKKSSNNGEKTDGESSYYSFYSSFFKTESGSAEDSDNKRSDKDSKCPRPWSRFSQTDDWYGKKRHVASMPKRSMDPPWMDQVRVTSDLIYKYQIENKNLEEVLSNDKERMKKMEQPPLVNEQLAQLYLDLQLEGVAARLTLEEGITSSSSSDEDNLAKNKKNKDAEKKKSEKKQEYSKLVMIYEEDAPFPPPDDGPCAPSLYYM